jgi:hypothetical protein
MKKILIALFICSSALTSVAQSESSLNAMKKDFGKNILAFNPVHLITRDFVGVGFSYERLVNNYVGLKIPVMIAMNNNYYNIGIEAKLYPTKNTGAVKYAIAPAIMLGIGENKYQTYNYVGSSYVRIDVVEKASHFGFLLNQTLNVTITRQFFIGIDGGLGINYYDEKANTDNANSKLSFLAQLHIGMGYRF